MSTEIDKAIGQEIRKLLKETEDLKYADVFRIRLLRRANELDPPRLPEPGMWGVVKADYSATYINRVHWVRNEWGWQSSGGITVEWHQLINPELVRAGVGDS